MKISQLTALLLLSLVSGFSHAIVLSPSEEKALIVEANNALAQHDYKTAFTKFSTLSEHGIASAQFNLGAFYLNGQGVQKDERLAYEWFQKSAAQGNARALQVIEKAAARGNIHAKNELAKLQNPAAAVQPQPQASTQSQEKAKSAQNKLIATEPGMHLVFNFGATFGGDEIFSATYTSGETVSVKGGDLFQFGLGGLYQFEDVPVALMLSANYHVDGATASNGNMSFRRYPIETLVYYTGVENVRIGGGVRIVKSPESSMTINGATEKFVFDNATGYVAELGYKLGEYIWINFRYVSEKYQGKTYTATSGATYSLSGTTPLDGSHFGFSFLFEN